MICILYKAVHCKQSSTVYYFYDCTKKSPILRSWGQHPYTWHHSPTPTIQVTKVYNFTHILYSCCFRCIFKAIRWDGAYDFPMVTKEYASKVWPCLQTLAKNCLWWSTVD